MRRKMFVILLLLSLVLAGCSRAEIPGPDDMAGYLSEESVPPPADPEKIEFPQSEAVSESDSDTDTASAIPNTGKETVSAETVSESSEPASKAETSEPSEEPKPAESDPPKSEPDKPVTEPPKRETPSDPPKQEESAPPTEPDPPVTEESPAPVEPLAPEEPEPPKEPTQADFDRIIAEVRAYAESYRDKGFTFVWKEEMEFSWDVGWFGTPRICYEGIDGTIDMLKYHVDKIYKTSTDPKYGLTSDRMPYKVVQITVDGDIAFAVIYGG